MTKKNKKKDNINQKHFPWGIILSILGMIGGFYVYQYIMRPEINLLDIEAQYTRLTQKDDMRIDFTFKAKNDGGSKTKDLKLYSVFPKWAVDQKGVIISPYDFNYTDISNLLGGKEASFEMYKDINADDFVQCFNMSEGIYLIVVFRWQSDNLAFLGRTFENHILFLLKPAMRDNRMVFQIQRVEQKYFTYWGIKQSDKPEIFKVVEGLGATKLLYGDVSRFD